MKQKRKMKMAKRGVKKNKGGRPATRGPTIPVAFRLSVDLGKRIEMLRLASAEDLTRTQAIERLIRRGLDDEEADIRALNAEDDARRRAGEAAGVEAVSRRRVETDEPIG